MAWLYQPEDRSWCIANINGDIWPPFWQGLQRGVTRNNMKHEQLQESECNHFFKWMNAVYPKYSLVSKHAYNTTCRWSKTYRWVQREQHAIETITSQQKGTMFKTVGTVPFSVAFLCSPHVWVGSVFLYMSYKKVILFIQEDNIRSDIPPHIRQTETILKN